MNTQRISYLLRAFALPSLLLLLATARSANADVSFSVTVAPPALPIYAQPPIPGDGFMWTPGYWGWNGYYYWVPGTWVLAPAPGLLWTPGYWGWENAAFVFHEGYWAPHVGFYGGINYGFGYGGLGFSGGYWQNGGFYYNRAIANVNETVVRNVYTKTVINNTTNVVSYNGGTGGTTARPSETELRAANERHLAPVAAQTEHVKLAQNNPELRAEANHGQPPIAATERPSQFTGHNVVKASQAGEPYRPAAQRRVASRDETMPDEAKPGANAERREEMQARHEQERHDLENRQAQERAEMERQHVSAERRETVAADHARQQEELAKRHKHEEQELEGQPR